MMQCSAMQCSSLQFSSISRIKQCHRRHKKGNQTHTHSQNRKYSHACAYFALVWQEKKKKRQQYKSQWNRKRCYTNSETLMLCVDYCMQFTIYWFLLFLPLSVSNWIESKFFWLSLMKKFYHCCCCCFSNSIYFVPCFLYLPLSSCAFLIRQFRGWALISVFIFEIVVILLLLLVTCILLQENKVIIGSSNINSSGGKTIITRKSEENSKCTSIPKKERIPFIARTQIQIQTHTLESTMFIRCHFTPLDACNR